jgi:hypothetical protein
VNPLIWYDNRKIVWFWFGSYLQAIKKSFKRTVLYLCCQEQTKQNKINLIYKTYFWSIWITNKVFSFCKVLSCTVKKKPWKKAKNVLQIWMHYAKRLRYIRWPFLSVKIMCFIKHFWLRQIQYLGIKKWFCLKQLCTLAASFSKIRQTTSCQSCWASFFDLLMLRRYRCEQTLFNSCHSGR